MGAQARLVEVTALVEDAGGRVVSVAALADPDDVHVVVAHRVGVSSPTPGVDVAVRAILADHAVPTDGLVPWVDPDAPDPEDWEAGP